MNKKISSMINLVCISMLASAAHSQEVADDTAEAATTSEQLAGGGRMIIIDPETGEMASGQRLIDVADSTKLRSTGSIITPGVASAPKRLDDGTILIKLNGQFMMPMTVSMDENGNLEQEHQKPTTQESDK